jgi:hypothetical protein
MYMSLLTQFEIQSWFPALWDPWPYFFCPYEPQEPPPPNSMHETTQAGLSISNARDPYSGDTTFVSRPVLPTILRLNLIFFLIRVVGGGVQTGSTPHVGHWMAYCTCLGWLWWWRIWWNEDWQGKPKYSEKTCPSPTLPTTNPTWQDPGREPGPPRWEASD